MIMFKGIRARVKKDSATEEQEKFSHPIPRSWFQTLPLGAGERPDGAISLIHLGDAHCL
jgi:hypothetical protein